MHQKMGKLESSRTSKTGGKLCRKTLLGNTTLAVFLQPTLSDFISSSSSTRQQLQDGDCSKSQSKEFSATKAFSMLKDANKVIVKGAKLYESLNELRLCGWINPYTLLLIGPSEDMKVVKHAWIKRHLKSPKGYFVKDIGLVRDCIVEMLTQSPFMSLTTALFEAVADLNHQNIFPTKDTLYEYLRKNYPEIKTPDTKIIHDCLGRLIKNRRLYHNGRGYFILLNENVLNEVISLKSSLQPQQHPDTTSLEPSVVGFKINDSRTSSSGQTDTQHTDLDLMSGDIFKNRKRHDSSSAGDTLTEVSTIAEGVANLSELNTPKLPRTTLGSKLFRRSNSKPEKPEKKLLNYRKITTKPNSNVFSTTSESIILTNDLVNSPLHVSMDKQTNNGTITNNDVIDSSVYSDDVIEGPTSTPRIGDERERKKPKRSKSFSGKTRKARLNKNKEVSFALIGSPNHQTDDESSEGDVEPNRNPFQRSHSFGVGYSKNIYQRPQLATIRAVPTSYNLDINGTVESSSPEPESTLDRTLDNTEELDAYEDLETSFVDDSVPSFEPDQNLKYDAKSHLAHRPDMLPVSPTATFEALGNYKDLGSVISLHRINDKAANFNVLDLLSPTKEESLAEELKQAYDILPARDDSGDKESAQTEDFESIDLKLLSPRSRRKFGTPYESQYLSEVLNQSEEICQALQKSKKDDNSNYIETKNDGSTDSGKNKNNDRRSSSDVSKNNKDNGNKSVKMRSRTKSNEERKRSQKERNSQLFEEKRASLKVMGMV